MKYILILLLFATTCLGQVQTIRHLKYTTRFDTQKHYVVRADWWLTQNMLICAKPFPRAEEFTMDPLSTTATDINRDYIGSGYDKGHNMSAEDNRCSGRGMAECFYLSNVSPQHPILNRGIWKELEDHLRKQALQDDSLYISSGSFGEITHIKSLTVPAYWWKVIYTKKTKSTVAYLFKNDASSSIGKLEDFKISITELEQKSGLKFTQRK
jgi:endonuclease G